eukprot:1160789-Pelagomonas_calceolata.AAC.6
MQEQRGSSAKGMLELEKCMCLNECLPIQVQENSGSLAHNRCKQFMGSLMAVPPSPPEKNMHKHAKPKHALP